MSTAVLNMRPNIEKPDTGVEKNKLLAEHVCACLSDSYLLMAKTQGCHWNVVGPLFHSVHLLTEEQYNDLFTAIDVIAERIRALGYPAPSSITEMVSLSEIQEFTGNPTSKDMVANLANDHETVARRFRQSVSQAERAADVVTADILTTRMAFHEKAAWMLRAILAD